MNMQAVQVMTKICRESEASLDYSALFRGIIKRAPTPMSPLESLASSAVRTAHKVRCQPILLHPIKAELHKPHGLHVNDACAIRPHVP